MLSIKSTTEMKIGQGKLVAYTIFSSETVCVTSKSFHPVYSSLERS